MANTVSDEDQDMPHFTVVPLSVCPEIGAAIHIVPNTVKADYIKIRIRDEDGLLREITTRMFFIWTLLKCRTHVYCHLTCLVMYIR